MNISQSPKFNQCETNLYFLLNTLLIILEQSQEIVKKQSTHYRMSDTMKTIM
jgi:hypothetical protein